MLQSPEIKHFQASPQITINPNCRLPNESRHNPFTSHPQVQDLFSRLDHPTAIQAYLDSVPYSPEERNRCPLNVVREGTAHCLDGGLFAAASLRRLGYPPRLV